MWATGLLPPNEPLVPEALHQRLGGYPLSILLRPRTNVCPPKAPLIT